MPTGPSQAVSLITDPAAAGQLVHPLRARIVAHAREPTSAAELGEVLDESRQKVNYHVKKLEAAGLLEPAGQRQARGFTENLYQATGQAYLLAPEVLGPAAPAPGEATDRFSASYLLALTGRTQSELARVLADAEAADQRVATLSMDTTVHLADAQGRAAFARALQEAVTGLVDRFSEPGAEGSRPFRMIVGMHPKPADDPEVSR